MSIQLKNYIKFDEPNPTKEDRKKYAAKNRKGCNSSDYEYSAKEDINEEKLLKERNKHRLKVTANATKKMAGNILEKIKKKNQIGAQNIISKFGLVIR